MALNKCTLTVWETTVAALMTKVDYAMTLRKSQVIYIIHSTRLLCTKLL